MTDDIQIYISPEDDVTSVRERLEKAPNRQITMVIPAQTQLRSLVAWRVLHADARRLGKDVLVISSDPQIRSLAQAGKFRVSPSQASSGSGRSRPQTRPSRNNNGRSRLISSQDRMRAVKKPSVQFPVTNEVTEEPRGEDRLNSWYGPVQQQKPATSSTLQSTEQPTPSTTGNLSEKNIYNVVEEPKVETEQFYNTPPKSSFLHTVPDIPQDESHQWRESTDFMQAEAIRRNSLQASSPLEELPQTPPTDSSSIQSPPSTTGKGSIYRTAPLEQDQDQADSEDEELSFTPYPMMDDELPSTSLNEQHGSAIINGLDTSEYPTSSDYPTHSNYAGLDEEIHEPVHNVPMDVEYLGDDTATNLNFPDEEILYEEAPEPLQNEAATRRRVKRPSAHLYKAGGTQNRARSASQKLNTANTAHQSDLDDDTSLSPSVEERPTMIMPPPTRPTTQPKESNRGEAVPAQQRVAETSRRPTSGPTGARRASQQVLGTSPRPTQPRQQTGTGSRNAMPTGQRRAQVPPSRQAPATRKLQESSRRSGASIILLIILLILIFGIPVYFVPTADVTLQLPSKNYSHALVLKAAANVAKGSTSGVVLADQLTNDFEATGTGKATGSVKVGTAPASGTVTFTNNGTSLIVIPSGTVVATSNGIAFTTQAEAVVDTASSNTGGTVDIPIQAQASGTNGNVAAGSITTIPPDGLNAIAMANKISGSSLKLTVTNKDATTSGGAGTSPAVSQSDLNTAKSALNTTLQNTFKSWLATKVAPGDQAGTLTTTETLENAPTASQVEPEGIFNVKLRLSVVVLVVSSTNMQQASIAQLNKFVKQEKTLQGYTVVDDAKHPIQIQQVKTTSDNVSMITLAFTAAGSVVQAIDVQGVRSSITGKSVKDAQATLLKIPGVRQVEITTGPQLGSWTPPVLPYWSPHITVHLVPEDTVKTPKK